MTTKFRYLTDNELVAEARHVAATTTFLTETTRDLLTELINRLEPARPDHKIDHRYYREDEPYHG